MTMTYLGLQHPSPPPGPRILLGLLMVMVVGMFIGLLQLGGPGLWDTSCHEILLPDLQGCWEIKCSAAMVNDRSRGSRSMFQAAKVMRNIVIFAGGCISNLGFIGITPPPFFTYFYMVNILYSI